MPAQNTVAKLMDVGVVVLSLVLYTGGRTELLNCIVLCVCSLLLTEGLEQAGTQSSLLRVADTCANQANAILDLPAMHISGAELNPERRDLHVENVRFSYGEKPIIMDSLMRNFSFVFQNVYLFHDTVANNIRFGQPDAPMEQIVEAARNARCHVFIMNLP